MFVPVPGKGETEEQELTHKEWAEQKEFDRTHPDYVYLLLPCKQCGETLKVCCNAVGDEAECPKCGHCRVVPDAFPDGGSTRTGGWPVSRIEMHIPCPRCGKRYRVKGEKAGRRSRCKEPSCGKIFRVPPLQKQNLRKYGPRCFMQGMFFMMFGIIDLFIVFSFFRPSGVYYALLLAAIGGIIAGVANFALSIMYFCSKT